MIEKDFKELLTAQEKEIKFHRRFLSDLFLQAPVAICMLRGQAHVVEVINESMLEIMGRTLDQLINKPIFEALPDAVNQGYEQILNSVYKTGQRFTTGELPINLYRSGKKETLFVKFICEPFYENAVVSGIIVIADEITELVKSREKARESEAEYKQLIETLPLAMYTCDKEGRITLFNDVAVKLWGERPTLNDDNVKYCACYKVWMEEGVFVSPEKTPMAITLQTGRSFRNVEALVERKDGGKFYASVNVDPLFDSHGNIKGAINIFQDISDRKAIELALRESEQRYRHLLQGLPAAIYTTDINGYITLYNAAAAKLWGREPEIGKDMWCGSWKIYQPDGVTLLPLDECPMAILLKEHRKVPGVEIIVENPDGERRHILPHPEPIYDFSGKMIGAVNMLVDITERKMVEERMARFEAIVQSSEDAIISKTLNGVITSWNPAAERLFGYTESEMLGEHIFKIIPKDRFDEEPKIIERLRNGERVEHFETKRITKDGMLVDISLTISPVKDSQGNIIGASKIARDITKQKLLNEALRVSEERLRMAGESAKLGTWEFHPLTKKLIWSAECKKIYGFPENEGVESKYVAEHTYPDDAELVSTEVEKVMYPGNKENFQLEYRIIREPDRKVRWVRVHGKVFFDDENKPDRFIGTMLDISEEKESVQQIEEKEDRLRMAVVTAKLGTWEYNPVTSEFFCSEESKRICGLPEKIHPDFQTIINYIHEEDKDYFVQKIENAINPANGKFDMQLRIYRYEDKGMRWVRAQGKVFFDGNQQPERLIGTMLDITREKLQEQELKESVELFQTMADNVPAMIWMSGSDKFNDYFNKTWLQFTGRTPEEESNEGWLEGVHAEDRQKCVDTYNESVQTQKEFYTEYRLRRHDGQYRWVADKSVPRFSSDGEFLGFISACMDIDDQKRFREKIMANELLFKTITNAPPVGLWMTDVNAQNTFVNDTWIQWTGIPYEQQKGVGWLSKVIDEDKKEAPAKFWDAMTRRVAYKTEFRIIRKDGEMRWCLTEGFPYYDIDGEFAGYAGSVTDITDMKRLEQRKDDFIKMASHELKTPVTTIKGYIQLMLKMFTSEKNIFLSESLFTIDKQVSKLSKLIADLLDATRIETGQLLINHEVVRLTEIIQDIVKDFRTTSLTHTVVFNNHSDPLIYADRDRITQVISNLLSNAIKYSPKASTVVIETHQDEKEVIVSIRDYGIGIDEKDHHKIFERFFRVSDKQENTFPGFGIGLFIVKEIVSLHKGKVWVESAKGKGAIFYFSLPVYEEK